MPSRDIKDPEVHRLAHILAGRRGVSATRAVRDALEEALRRDAESRAGLADRLLAVSHRSRSVTDPVLTDDHLYDADGLPR